MKTKNKPQHPGAYLAEIQPGIMSKTALAERLNVARDTLYSVLRGKRRIDPAMAAILGEITDKSAREWLEMQLAWDLAQACKSRRIWPPLSDVPESAFPGCSTRFFARWRPNPAKHIPTSSLGSMASFE